MKELQQAIRKRVRPEDVLKGILKLPLALSDLERRFLEKFANPRYPTYMGSDYRTAKGLDGNLKAAKTLFPNLPFPEGDDLQDYIAAMRAELHVPAGVPFRQRPNKGDRANLGIQLNSGAYNKRLRLVERLEAKAKQHAFTTTLFQLEQAAKVKLAGHLDVSQVTHPETLAFVAYMTSRLGLRSLFTSGSQIRAYDEVAEILMGLCVKSRGTNWFQIAHVYTEGDVVRRLSDSEKGQLLGQSWLVMRKACEVLKDLDDKGGINHKTLVVQRGNDSSTWNAAAGAYNKARDAWISLLFALDSGHVLERLCPGKALRLMAADVVRWHSGGLEPNTFVYGELPRPWEVVLGKKTCTAANIEDALTRCKADNKTRSAWVTPRGKSIEKTTFTPELVHGVVVSAPDLAQQLRKLGVFSGKKLKDIVKVQSLEDVIDDERAAHIAAHS